MLELTISRNLKSGNSAIKTTYKYLNEGFGYVVRINENIPKVSLYTDSETLM